MSASEMSSSDAGFNSRSRMGSDTQGRPRQPRECGFNSRSRMGSDNRAHLRPLRPRCFNSRSRMGSDAPPGLLDRRADCFNSRSRMGSDEQRTKTYSGRQSFNSRSRMGSDLPDGVIWREYLVSIHAPAWGATSSHLTQMASVVFQFTLPHGERPDDHVPSTQLLKVSIHAPAWGATCGWRWRRASAWVSIHAPAWGATGLREECAVRGDVSIHAPAWGATDFRAFFAQNKQSFNSRSRMGSDESMCQYLALPSVSIHAPAWGATGEPAVGAGAVGVSIHAPAWGATPSCSGCRSRMEFQFTLPHGERQSLLRLGRIRLRFNSRSRMGSDPEAGPLGVGHGGFNSRSRMGSDIPAEGPAHGLSGFNSRSRMGSDLAVERRRNLPRRFNSRSRMGSDVPEPPAASVSSVSIHAPAWGATFPTCACARAHVFQFTLPHGERRGERAHGLPFLAFQFTLPHGERHEGDVCLVGVDSFNSRSRMGSDRRSRATPGLVPEFQFTLPHGERPSWCPYFLAIAVFQFTLPHGERPHSPR